jgi:hypothetical protein
MHVVLRRVVSERHVAWQRADEGKGPIKFGGDGQRDRTATLSPSCRILSIGCGFPPGIIA